MEKFQCHLSKHIPETTINILMAYFNRVGFTAHVWYTRSHFCFRQFEFQWGQVQIISRPKIEIKALCRNAPLIATGKVTQVIWFSYPDTYCMFNRSCPWKHQFQLYYWILKFCILPLSLGYIFLSLRDIKISNLLNSETPL